MAPGIRAAALPGFDAACPPTCPSQTRNLLSGGGADHPEPLGSLRMLSRTGGMSEAHRVRWSASRRDMAANRRQSSGTVAESPTGDAVIRRPRRARRVGGNGGAGRRRSSAGRRRAADRRRAAAAARRKGGRTVRGRAQRPECPRSIAGRGMEQARVAIGRRGAPGRGAPDDVRGPRQSRCRRTSGRQLMPQVLPCRRPKSLPAHVSCTAAASAGES